MRNNFDVLENVSEARKKIKRTDEGGLLHSWFKMQD